MALAGTGACDGLSEVLDATADDDDGVVLDAGSADPGPPERSDGGIVVDAGSVEDDCVLNDVGWVGVVDPELDGPDPAWTISPHGSHRAIGQGPDHYILFQGSSLCTLGGEVAQEVHIPVPCAGLVPAVNFNVRTSAQTGEGIAGLRVDGVTMPYGGSHEEIGCLGDASFGKDVTLSLFGRAAGITAGCDGLSASVSVDLTRAKLVGAGTCPAPGQVAALSTWRFFREGLDVPVGNQALTLALPGACDLDQAFAPNEGGVSIPLAMENPALHFDMTGSLDGGAHIVVGFGLGTLRSTDNARICLPRSRRGYVLPLGLQLLGPGGLCSVRNRSEVTVGAITLVDDPGCASDDVGVIDPELMDPRQWPREADAAFQDGVGPGEPGTGVGAVALTATTECEGGQLFGTVDVPRRDDTAHALVVQYALAGTDTAELLVSMGSSNTRVLLPDTLGSLVEERICIDPFIGGDLAPLSIALGQPPDLFCDLPPGSMNSRAVIESVRVIADPSCPLPPR